MRPTEFEVPADQQIELFRVGLEMQDAGLPPKFVAEAVDVGTDYLGVYELVVMWSECDDPDERREIVADIQEMIDECRSDPGVKEERYVEFTDLDTISEHIEQFKDSLRLEVERRCDGLTELSERTGMPVPSLSRFFNSTSIPRRATLLKIADALDMSAVEISTDWSYEA